MKLTTFINKDRFPSIRRVSLTNRKTLLLGSASLLLVLNTTTYAKQAESPVSSSAVNNPQANEQVAQSGAGIQEITVTARRRSEKAQDVPISISVLSGDKLASAGVDTIQQLQFIAPDLGINVFNPRNVDFAIRGIGNNPANDGLAGSVGFYVDGIYLDRPGMSNFNLFDLQQLEVLRGPQGTLFGKNTTAGALNVLSKPPSFDPEASAEVSYGSYNTQDIKGVISGPLVDGILAGRFSFYSDSHSGYVNSTNGQSLDGLNRRGFRAQLLYKPTDDITDRLIFEYGQEHDNSGIAILYNTGPAKAGSATFPTFSIWTARDKVTPLIDPYDYRTDISAEQVMKTSAFAVTNHFDWTNADGYTLTSVTGVRNYVFKPHNNGISVVTPGTGSDVALSSEDINHDWQASEELRLASPTGGPVDYVVGAYSFWKRLTGDSQTWYGKYYYPYVSASAANAVLNNSLSRYDTDPRTLSAALFAQGNWHIDDRWTLTAGLRETWERNWESILRYPLEGGSGKPPATLGYYSGAADSKDWNYGSLLSLSYKIEPDVMAYGSLSHGAKAGGFNAPAIPAQKGTTFLPTSTLRVYPESIDSGEAGIKSTLFNHHVVFNFDGFVSRVTNYQASAYVVTPVGTISALQNVGAVVSKGLEADLTWRPVEGLTIDANGSFDQATYQSFRNAPSVQGDASSIQDLTGKQVVLAPRWTASVNATYYRPINDNLVAYVGGDYAYRSSQFGNIDDSTYSALKAYNLVDFRIGAVINENYDVSFWIQNAFDTHYFYNTAPLSGGLGGYAAYPVQPRVIGGTLKVKL